MLSLVGVFSCFLVWSLFKFKKNRFDCKPVTVRNNSSEVSIKQVQISMKTTRNSLRYTSFKII